MHSEIDTNNGEYSNEYLYIASAVSLATLL